MFANERGEANALQAKVDASITFVNIMKGRQASDLEKAIRVTEEVQQWYALSKPYQLRLFEACGYSMRSCLVMWRPRARC